MIEYLQHLDEKWLLAINGYHSPFFDTLMWWLSDRWIWVPFYLSIVVTLILKYKKQAIPLLLLVVLLIVASDQLASGILKPWVQRLRPSHDPDIKSLLHFVNGYRGGTYGFVSSHAINVFSLSFYLSFTTKDKIKWLPYVLFPWAVAVSYSRIYLGVHYPFDVLVPVILSLTLAYAMSKAYSALAQKYFPQNSKL